MWLAGENADVSLGLKLSIQRPQFVPLHLELASSTLLPAFPKDSKTVSDMSLKPKRYSFGQLPSS